MTRPQVRRATRRLYLVLCAVLLAHRGCVYGHSSLSRRNSYELQYHETTSFQDARKIKISNRPEGQHAADQRPGRSDEPDPLTEVHTRSDPEAPASRTRSARHPTLEHDSSTVATAPDNAAHAGYRHCTVRWPMTTAPQHACLSPTAPAALARRQARMSL